MQNRKKLRQNHTCGTWKARVLETDGAADAFWEKRLAKLVLLHSGRSDCGIEGGQKGPKNKNTFIVNN